MSFFLDQKVRIPVPDGDKISYEIYDTEIGTVSKAILGFDPDHRIFGFSIEIEEMYHNNDRSTGHRSIDHNNPQSMALIRRIVEVVGGKYSNFNDLVGRPAILLRDRQRSAVPVGIASPVTHEYCLFDTDYTDDPEKNLQVPF